MCQGISRAEIGWKGRNCFCGARHRASSPQRILQAPARQHPVRVSPSQNSRMAARSRTSWRRSVPVSGKARSCDIATVATLKFSTLRAVGVPAQLPFSARSSCAIPVATVAVSRGVHPLLAAGVPARLRQAAGSNQIVMTVFPSRLGTPRGPGVPWSRGLVLASRDRPECEPGDERDWSPAVHSGLA